MNVKISIVIPTLNRSTMLNVAVDSIVNAASYSKLSKESYEIIIVDDSDGDLSDVVIENSDAPVALYKSPSAPKGGASTCRNYAVSQAEGSIIFFLDDDDYFLENRFEKCLPLYESSNVEVILEPSVRESIANDKKTTFIAGPKEEKVSNIFEWMLYGDESTHIATGATSFLKDTFNRVGGLDENLLSCEDGELLLRFCCLSEVVLLAGEPVVHCVTHESNSSRESKRKLFENMRALSFLYKNLQPYSKDKENNNLILKTFISKKLDYLLYLSHSKYSFPNSIIEGLHILRFFKWNCVSSNNMKSIAYLFFRSWMKKA